MGESPSSALPQLKGLTIEAVEWLPSGADSGLVRVRGRWSATETARQGLPALVLSARGAVHRFESLPDARFARDPASWRGSYLVPTVLVASEPEALWIEWPGGVRSGLPPLAPGLATPPPSAPPAPAEPPVAGDEPEGGQLIDRAVLAERRARRAEAAEQAQGRVAAEALRAVEALELQSSELERRLADATAERDALASEAPSTAVPAEAVRLAERRQAALAGALDSLARLRAQSHEWRLKLRTGEIAHAGDAVRLAVLEAERSTGDATRAALHARAGELEAERRVSERRAAELAEAERLRDEAEAQLAAAHEEATSGRAQLEAAREQAEGRLAEALAAVEETRANLERRRRGERAIHEEVREALSERLEAASGRATALEAARAELAAAREAAEARAAELAARVTELEATLTATETRLHAATAAAAAVEARLRVESVARVALEDELDRDREARAALAAELERVRTELEAERRARQAAERAAAASRHEGDTLQERIAALDRHAAGLADEVRLQQAAREQAEAAAAAARRPEAESGRLVADLDAAAASLRADAPVEAAAPAAPAPPPAAAPAAPAPPAATTAPAPPPAAAAAPAVERVRPTIVPASGHPPRVDAVGRSARNYPPLRGAIVKLAHDDPHAAGRLIAALLPAHAAALAEALDYDLTIREVGTYAVTVAGGRTRVQPLAFPRPRGQADFHLTADALTLAELLAGVQRRVGRFVGPARFRGSRRRLKVLKALPETRLSVAEAARAGARLEPGLVYRALSYAVHPSWTRGERFTIAQEITGSPPETWYLTARDGAGLSVSTQAPPEGADATVSMTREAFGHLLRGEPVPRGSRPSVRGDRDVVARMKAWTERAQGQPRA
jgi:hypothetical protein